LANQVKGTTFFSNRGRLILIALCAVLLASFAIYQGKQPANSGSHEAGALVQSLHAAMAKHDWDSIYANADGRYRQVLTPEESARMFERVVIVLGEPVFCKPGKTSSNKRPEGDTIQTECETTFSHNAMGHEMFYWHESGGEYRLSGYNVSSKALMGK
jgi:hypothetical protein